MNHNTMIENYYAKVKQPYTINRNWDENYSENRGQQINLPNSINPGSSLMSYSYQFSYDPNYNNQPLQHNSSCSPDYIRSVYQKIPVEKSILEKLPIPIGLYFRPLAISPLQIPDIDNGATGNILRCSNCRTYINPYCRCESSTTKWLCNICDTSNDIPSSIYTKENNNFLQTKMELNNYSVEYIASADYMLRPPQAPIYLFLIDVTLPSLESGLLSVVTSSIQDLISRHEIPGANRAQIGIITFDSAIHFFKLNGSGKPQMIVVSSISDVFIPFPEGILVDIEEHAEAIKQFLIGLPNIWNNQKVLESCLGSALIVANSILQASGGKLLVFCSTVPTLGEYTININRTIKIKASNNDSSAPELLKPFDYKFVQLAKSMSQHQICVDIFACPSICSQKKVQSLDLATLSNLSKYTAGELRYYPSFNKLVSGVKLKNEIRRVITRLSGWESVMRVRIPVGWKITEITGNFYSRPNNLLALPNCHEDQTFGIQVEIEDYEKVSTKPFFYVQSALLYTNSNGERRIRVHSSFYPTTHVLNECLLSIDENMALAMLIYQSIKQASTTNIADASSFLINKCKEYSLQLSNLYNKNIDEISIVPLGVLGFLKSTALRQSEDVTPDIRIYTWLRLCSLPLHDLYLFTTPDLYNLNISNDVGNYDMNNQVILPSKLVQSSKSISVDGAYLICNGECILLWIGKAISSEWLQNVLFVNSLHYVETHDVDSALDNSNSPYGYRIKAVINSIRASCLQYMNLVLVKQGSPIEYKFLYLLIRDKNSFSTITYDCFLSTVCGLKMQQTDNNYYLNAPKSINSMYPVQTPPQSNMHPSQPYTHQNSYSEMPNQGLYMQDTRKTQYLDSGSYYSYAGQQH